ncbi:PAS domain S-box protein [Halobaculum marinum]|uniref:histidine kinase n=1 Tax=Halobaculum marinum TaxID=3031996 RepID=A0ABD5WZZ5_9EURY|nr:PAS domain S-box protein [Halobaculum sp. DT55]
MSGSPDPVALLHVDGDRSFAADVQATLATVDGGVDVERVSTVRDARAALDDGGFDCVVTAYALPDGDGVELVEVARAAGHTLPFVLFADDDCSIPTGEAVGADLAGYLPKDTSDDSVAALATATRAAVAAHRTDTDGRHLDDPEPDLANWTTRRDDRFDAAFEALPYPAAHVDIADGVNVVKSVNSAFESVFGVDRQTAAGRSINDLIVPPDGVSSARAIDDRVAAGELVEAELERVTADGPKQFLFRAQGFEGADGGGEALGVYVEITERNRRQRELERYARIIEAAGDPVYTLDAEGNFSYVNRQLGALTGYDSDDLVGEHVSTLMDPEDVRRGTDLIRELISDPERERGTVRILIKTDDGEKIQTETHIALLPRDDEAHDAFAGTVGVIRDITDRVERERRLEAQNERLDAFTGVVGHDLRNPLNVAQGHLDLARESDDPVRCADSFEAVERSLERMERLIDSLLVLAREGEPVVEPEPVRIADVAEACKPMAETMGGTLDVRASGRVLADESRVQQLVENLVRNAIEHGQEGVTVSVVDTDDGFAVMDDGPGIPEDVRENVFETGYSTTVDGTGLGLSIVARVAEDHGWELSVDECAENGTRIEVNGITRPDGRTDERQTEEQRADDAA